jgi:hypothetical protein
MTDDDLGPLFEALGTNSTLGWLNLRGKGRIVFFYRVDSNAGNRITDKGAKKFFDNLKNNRTLVGVNLAGNDITDGIANDLQSLLEANHKLFSLDLSCKGDLSRNFFFRAN